jgi:type IV pilus assembly protein PilA
MPKNSIPGFSLIELMIVVSILGIISVIAVPCYQNYTQRARFAEIISATEPFKIAIAAALQTGANMNELNSGKTGIPPTPKATKNLASVNVKNGVITATASKLLGNKTFILRPDDTGSNWSVSGTCIDAGICNV